MRFRDGIGVRIASADAFGEPIEQLQLCTDLAALESAVRERVSRLINFRHVRYVRLRGSERLTNATKDVVVTYDAVPGTRLSEFLELALHAPLRIDIDTALQIVRELLPAIAVLHDSRNVTHGAIGPERLVLTPQGRLVIVDHGLGLALGKLGYSRKRLWQQLRVPVPQGTGKIVFDARTDVIQIGMVALALILGRPIEEADFPQNLERLLDGAKETPSIGQSRSLSNELRAWLDRSLPLEKRVAFATVREAQQEFEKLFSGTRYGASSNALKNLVAKYAAVAQGKAPVEDIPAAAAAGVPTGATAAPEPIGAPMIENAIERGLGNGRRIAEPPPLARPDDHIPAETEVAVTSLADAVGLGPKGRVRATPTRKALVTPITDPHPRDAGLGAKPPANARAAGAPSSSSLPAINAKSVDIKAPDVKTAGVVKGDAKSTAAKTVDVKTADVKAAGVRGPDLTGPDLKGPDLKGPDLKGPDLKGTAAKGADAKSAQKPAAKAPLAADVAAFEEVAEDTYTDAQLSIATKGTQAAPPAASAKIATSDVDAQSILLMDSVDDETPLMPAAAFEDPAPDLDRFAGMGARNAAKKIEAAPVARAPEVKAPEVKAPEVKAPAAKAPAVKAPEAKTPELKTPEFKTPEPKTADPKLAEPKAPVLKVEVKAPEVKAPAAKAPEVKAPAVNAPTVIAPAAKTPAVNVPATIAPAAKGPAVNAPAAKVPAANVPVNVPSMNVPAASDAEASPLFSATPALTVTSAAPIAVTPAVPAPPPDVPPAAKIPLPGTPVAQPAAPPAAVAPPKVSVPLPSAVPPVVTPVAPAASIATPAASSSVPLPVSKTPTPQAPAVAPPAVAVTPVAAPPVVTTPVAVTPVAVTPVTPAPAAPPAVAVTPVAAPPVASTPVTPVAATPVAPAPVAATPAVVTPVAKSPAPVAAPLVAATPVVAPPPVAMPSLPEPDLFAESAPAVVVEEPARKKSLASKLWAAVPRPKKAAPPPSIMSVPEEAEESVSAPPASVAPAATQMPAAAASGTPVVQAAPVAQPASPAAMTPASAKPAATVAPMVPAAAAPVAPVAPAARVNTPAAPTTTPAMPPSPSVDAPPAAAGTPATSTPEEKKSTTFDWHKDVAVTDAVPAWARGRIAGEEPVGNEGAVDFDEASGSLSAQVASASADRVSAFMAAPKPVVIKPEKEAPSPSSSSSSSASSSSSSAREADSSSSETRTLLRPGSGFFGADAADAAAEAEEGEKVVAFKAPRRQMPRIRINWRRTLAASLVVSIMEGVAFATAYWYVIPSETGSLLVETTPAGLEILVDGRVMGRTPFSDSLTPGRHTIELRQGTNSRVIPVEISSGVQTMQRITWAKGLQTGQARVTATAPNSEVTIDGKKWGKAPLTVSTLAAGKHMVQIESDAGTVSTPIAVSPGETTELDVPIYPGWVSVLAPVQLFIYEGERFLGTTEGEKLMLAPGKHTLDFVSEELGYKRSLEVTITPGATAAVSLPMPKVAVTVQGPEGADLIVDGEAMGKLPLTGLQVPLGTRDFVVKHPDHGEKRQVITVTNHAPMRVVMR